MTRPPPRSTQRSTLFPYTTLFRSPFRDEAAGEPALARPRLARAPCAVALGGGDPVSPERAEQGGVRRGPLHPRARRVLERVDQLVAARAVRLAPESERFPVGERVVRGGVEAAAAPPVQRQHLERERARIRPFEAADFQRGRVTRQRPHPAWHRQLLVVAEPRNAGEPGETHLLDRDGTRRVHDDAPLREARVPAEPDGDGDAQRGRLLQAEVTPNQRQPRSLAREPVPREVARRTRDQPRVAGTGPVEPPDAGGDAGGCR